MTARISRQKQILYVLTGIGVVLVGWAFWLEPASLRVSTHRLEVTRWPAACDGLRVAVLTDLHVGSPFNGIGNLRRIVDKTKEADPDLVLLPGDFVIHGVIGGQFVEPEIAADMLGEIEAEAGVYAVLGNHDWWLDGPRVIAALEGAGIPTLEDTSTLVRRGECEFALVGISDFWEQPHDIEKALSSVPEGQFTVAFTHNPDLFPDIPKSVSLTIAGHTHGGQVYFPGLGRLVVPSDYGERYAIGHIVEDARHLFVSSGVGTSILPVRFLVPPEITILEITGPQPDQG